jgi:NAD-dependent dihydropyrimidine dehydrogenase PreA subunit
MSVTPKKDETPKKDMKDVLAASGKAKCPVQKSQIFVEEFLSEPMCGKCHPCSLGSYEALVRIKRISSGKGKQEDMAAVRRIAEDMLESSRCIKGKDTAKFLLEVLNTASFREHLAGHCAERECTALIMFRVIPEKCTLCGLCKDACKHHAVQGEKQVSYRSGYLPFEIRQKRCIKCGDCMTACPTQAIIVTEVESKEPVGV